MTEPTQPEFYWPWPLFGHDLSKQWHTSRHNSEVLAALAQAAGLDLDPDALGDSDLMSWELGQLDFHNRFRLIYDDTGTALKIQKNDGTEAAPVWTDALAVDYETGDVTFSGSGGSSGFYLNVRTTGVGSKNFATDTLLFDRANFYISPNSIGKPVISLASEGGSSTPGISSITVKTTAPLPTFSTDTVIFDRDDFYLSPDSSGKPVVSLSAEAVASLSSITVETTAPPPSFSTSKIIFDRDDFYISSNSAGYPVVSLASEDANTTSLSVHTTQGTPVFNTNELIFDRANFYISPSSTGKPIVSWTGDSSSGGNPTVVSGVQSQSFSASVEWIFNHNLNSRPLLWSIYNNNFEAVLPDKLDISNPNTAYFYFAEAFAGTAIVSSGRTSVDLTGGFYGMSVRNNPRTESFKNINLLAFDAADFYLTQNAGNRDEVLISLRQSIDNFFVKRAGDTMTGHLIMNDSSLPQFRAGPSSAAGASTLPGFAFNTNSFTYGSLAGMGYREPFGIPVLELYNFGLSVLGHYSLGVANSPYISLNSGLSGSNGLQDVRYLGFTQLTTTQRDNDITPVEGMVIYNTTTNVLNFYNGVAWGAV